MMGEAIPEEEKTTGKRLCKSEPVVAHDLLVDNLELCKKLEEQEHALQKATLRIWSCEKYAKDAGNMLESVRQQYVSMEKALSQTQQEADTHARAAQDAVSAKAAVHDQVKPDRIPSTTPGAEPPRDAKDSGSARSHSTHLEASSSDRP